MACETPWHTPYTCDDLFEINSRLIYRVATDIRMIESSLPRSFPIRLNELAIATPQSHTQNLISPQFRDVGIAVK